jgi:hypothetical protein
MASSSTPALRLPTAVKLVPALAGAAPSWLPRPHLLGGLGVILRAVVVGADHPVAHGRFSVCTTGYSPEAMIRASAVSE